MASVPSLNLTHCLGPAEIQAAERAFHAALQAVDEGTARDLPPLALRRILARGIIEAALRGERDPDRLREAVLARLGLADGP